MLLEPYIDPNYFSLFVAPIALAAWVGGRGPGWLAIVLGTLLLNLVLLDRDDLVSVGRLVRTGAFFVAIVLVVEFVGSRRSASIRRRYDQAQDELRVRQTAEQQLM